MSEWCTTWLDTFAPNLKPNVREDYEGVIKRYIDGDTIGKRRLDKLTPTEVQAWVNRLTIRVAPQTVRNAHTRLHKALEVAVKNNYVPRNVASSTELPSVPKTDIQPLNSEQVQKLLDTVEGHRWAALYRLAVNLGMREAELFGLTWPAIDFERRAARHRLEDPRSLLTGCDRPDLRSRPRRVQVRRYRRTVAEAAKTAPPRYSVYYSVGPRNGLALP